MESTWFFTYWEASAKTPSQLHPDCKVFGSLGKLGEWRPTNELNKTYVEKKMLAACAPTQVLPCRASAELATALV